MKRGDFVWYELRTPDPAAAAAFYAAVIGWRVRRSAVPELDYTLLCLDERPVAGVICLPPAAMPDRPFWFGYVAVDDVDAKAGEAAAVGGGIHVPPRDIPGIGRFAVIRDPQGATFMLFKGSGTPPPALPAMTPGSIGWHELHGKDGAAALPFYEHLFGWVKDQAFPMGPLGDYQLFAIDGQVVGAVFTDAGTPSPYWLYYLAVDDIDICAGRVTRNGGALISEPQEVPGGAWVVQARDPQGGLFALVGMRRAEPEAGQEIAR